MILYPAPGAEQFGDTVITIDGLFFGLELDGVAWIFEDLKGWTLGGGVDASFEDRPSAHGAFDAPVYRRSRVINLKGACLADTPALAEDASDALASLIADGRMGTFTVANSRRALSAGVRLSDTPLDEWVDDRGFTWALQFTAPDMRKYGETVTATTGLPGGGTGIDYELDYPLDYGDPGATGRVEVANTGSAPTEPLIVVSGPLGVGFEVTHIETGRRLRYEQPVTQDVTLDCSTGHVSVQGQPRDNFLTVRDWPSIDPRSTATFQFSTLGGETFTSPARMSVTTAPAYW